MADYQKMYAVLCAAVDDVIDPLEEIPTARPIAQKLRHALETAEEIYMDTAPYETDGKPGKLLTFPKKHR